MNLPEQFIKRIVYLENGCWKMTGHVNINGYTYFGYTNPPGYRKSILAHRFSYERLVGPIAVGMVVDHLCRNRLCVNPSHMEIIGRGENVLRGDTLPAKNLKKTHCPKGHPYSGDNLYRQRRSPSRIPKTQFDFSIPLSGSRRCRSCAKEYQMELRKKRRVNYV